MAEAERKIRHLEGQVAALQPARRVPIKVDLNNKFVTIEDVYKERLRREGGQIVDEASSINSESNDTSSCIEVNMGGGGSDDSE